MKLSTCSSIFLGAAFAGEPVHTGYPGYTFPAEPEHLIWGVNEMEREFERQELHKEFVQYQMPDDEYVPIHELPIVYLNGIKFHRQGKEPKTEWLPRLRKITRSKSGHLQCKGNAKEARLQRHRVDHSSMLNDFQSLNIHQLDLTQTIFQTKYPRYNGRDVPLPYDELVAAPDLTNLEPENDFELAMQQNEVRHEDFEEIDEVNFPNADFIQPVVVDEDLNPQTDEQLEAIRLDNVRKAFKSLEKVKIGCCNGLPYNSSKRCCCRRIPFDKERKFCCAINGCQSFQIFDRNNKQHYKDCLSLSGLVIQEYGYQNGMPGHPAANFKRGGK